MTPRPAIFISAVSSELRSARQLVANTLTFLGYQPTWQDIFGTESGDLREMLREKIDQGKGVVQLVGKCYGSEPPAPDEKYGRVSYTQYEAFYARERDKKVWYLFIDENFPADSCPAEPEELRDLQAAYRRRLQADTHVFHRLTSHEALEGSVLKLRDDLSSLRRGVKRWAIGVVALLLFLSATSIWLIQGQRKQGEQVTAIVDRYQKMQQALVRLAEVETQAREPGAKLSPEEQRAAAYRFLEKELGLATGSLAKELPAFALELYNRTDTSALMRARAAYALGRLEEAEKLSLEGAAQDRQAYENAQRVQEERRKHAIEGYVLAGQSALKRVQYAAAMEHLREAEKLTDRERNPEDWAAVQFGIGGLLLEQGRFKDAESTLQNAVDVRAHVLGPEHPDTLRSRNALALALARVGKSVEAEAALREVIQLEEKVLGPEDPATLSSRHRRCIALLDQGKNAEAEAEYRSLIEVQAKVLGPEHPDTLISRASLAIALEGQAKYAQAEALYLELIKLDEKIVGPEHPDTLALRNNLGTTLYDEGKYAEAEALYRELIKIEEKVLGPEHPDTLATRHNLPNVLYQLGKYSEAEKQYREVARLREKVLGPEHPLTLSTRINLAEAVKSQGRYAEAEQQCREIIKVQEKVFGPEHPNTLAVGNNLAEALEGQGNYAEAEAQYRELIKTEERVLGPEHPATLDSCYNLAIGLMHEDKTAEAKEFARRAAEGARKALGPEHPSTRKYEKLFAELGAKP